MTNSAGYMEILSGRRRGLYASSVRSLLHGASWAYGGLLAVRNRWYDSLSLPLWLDVPVISVGNLTVGGTGKTPMCGWLCRRLLARGLKPAVLSRGYKASREGLADELLMLSRQYPQAVVIAHPDRFQAGSLATEQYGAQAAILDDGFQHRRLGRDLNLLLIDATCPFGFGFVLPRGLLREPVKGLLRADGVVLTRCDQARPEQVASLQTEIQRLVPAMPMAKAVHRPAGFTALDGKVATSPSGSRIGAFSGIARPEAFERTLADMGIKATEVRWWPDHHQYTSEDVAAIHRWVRQSRLDGLVTTEKDAVKLDAIKSSWPVPVSALHIEMEMLDDGEAVLSGLIDQMLAEHAEGDQLTDEDNGETDEEHSCR